MRTELKAKLLNFLAKNKKDEGFTLIELLVVIIIIGVLSAVALPNLLGQVGKARETEMKQAVGTVNRAQQGYHFEQQAFATNTGDLGVAIETGDFLDTIGISAATPATSATVQPTNNDAADDGTRAYSGGIFFSGGDYGSIICQSAQPATSLSAPSGSNTCASGNELE